MNLARTRPPALLPAPSDPETLTRLVENVRAVRMRQKLSTVPQDVWELVEEMERSGGTLDLTVQIARLEQMYLEIEEFAKPDVRKMTVVEAFKQKMRLTMQVAKLKSQAIDAKKKTNRMVGDDLFLLMTEGLKQILAAHLHNDPHLMQAIGNDMGDLMIAILAQLRQPG